MEGNYVFIALILLVKQGKHKICLQRSRITLLSTEKRQRHLKEPGHRQQQYFLERLLTDYDWLWISDWCEDYHVPCPIICVCSKSGHSLCFPHLLENDSLEERRIWEFQAPSSCYPCDMENIWHLRYPESITSQRHQCFNSIKGNFEIFPNHRDHLFGVCALMSQQYYRSENQVQG